jgi:hypothetical protein
VGIESRLQAPVQLLEVISKTHTDSDKPYSIQDLKPIQQFTVPRISAKLVTKACFGGLDDEYVMVATEGNNLF